MTTYRVVYASNGAKIGDGMRVARVSEDGARLEILTDVAAGRFSAVTLKQQDAAEEPEGFSDGFSDGFA